MRRHLKSLVAFVLSTQARAVIRKYKPSIIAVTGSVGKTSTKDAIYAALAEQCFVRKSEKSFNSDIGIPLTILGAPNGWSNPLRWLQIFFDGFSLLLFKSRYPDWLVLEVGADRPGDIRTVAAWLPVDIAVITRLPEMPVHVEYFDSPAEVIEEKAALITALKPSGTLVLYADDEATMGLAARAPGARVLSFGFAESASVHAERVAFDYTPSKPHQPLGMHATVVSGAARVEACLLGTAGSHTLLPLLAACAVGEALGMPLSESVNSFNRQYMPPPGRMRLLAGVSNTLLIDDSYNSSPAAIAAALETLASLRTKGRRIALIGDMLELGRYSVDEHRKIGTQAAHICNLLFTVGFRARDVAEAALDTGLPDTAVLQFEDAERAGELLLPMLKEGDIILIKGSQSMRMERAAAILLAQPERASELLVRQEEEWQLR